MNIIHISPGEQRIPAEKGGGIEAYILMLSKSSLKAGHNVTIVDRKHSPSAPDVEYIDRVKHIPAAAWMSSSVRSSREQAIWSFTATADYPSAESSRLWIFSAVAPGGKSYFWLRTL